MKKILFATDFSPKSQRALRYALQLHSGYHASNELEVMLLHVDNPSPLIHPEVGAYAGVSTIINEQIQLKEEKLSKIRGEWERIYPQVGFKQQVLSGAISAKIREMAVEENVDLISVGASGYGPVEQAILGSTAVGLSKHAPCPVLVVPEGAVMAGPERIVLATDFKNLNDVHILDPLLQIKSDRKAELMLLHIYQNEHQLLKENFVLLEALEQYFGNENFDYYFLQNDDTLNSLEQFVSGYHADLLTVVAQERNFFEELFHRSLTRRLIFHSRIPILILHPIFWSQ